MAAGESGKKGIHTTHLMETFTNFVNQEIPFSKKLPSTIICCRSSRISKGAISETAFVFRKRFPPSWDFQQDDVRTTSETCCMIEHSGEKCISDAASRKQSTGTRVSESMLPELDKAVSAPPSQHRHCNEVLTSK